MRGCEYITHGSQATETRRHGDLLPRLSVARPTGEAGRVSDGRPTKRQPAVAGFGLIVSSIFRPARRCAASCDVCPHRMIRWTPSFKSRELKLMRSPTRLLVSPRYVMT